MSWAKSRNETRAALHFATTLGGTAIYYGHEPLSTTPSTATGTAYPSTAATATSEHPFTWSALATSTGAHDTSHAVGCPEA